MVSLILIIIMDLVMMALVMVFGTRREAHAPTLESRSVVAMQALARARMKQIQDQAAQAGGAGGEVAGAGAQDAEAKKAEAAARREAALARKAARQKAADGGA